MSIRSYDQKEAQGLIPFFQSIANEVGERRSALHSLEVKRRSLASDSSPGSNQLAQVQAEHANHRKELRLALREITRLGCTIEHEDPLRVAIPGPQGEIEGFIWSAGEPFVEVSAAESAA